MNENDRLIIAGGGLAGCLAALAVNRSRPDVPILLIEQEEHFGGTHVWSFFDPDIAPEDRWLVDPLIAGKWDSYDVAFPERKRTLATAYHSLTSERLDALVRTSLPEHRYRTGTGIASLAPDHVRLTNGETLGAGAVIDARGPGQAPGLELGWQKFLGLHLELEAPHALARPIVMDATVDQAEGYRFVYCLPFSETRLLVEDTYYSLSPTLDRERLRGRAEDYARARGWKITDCAGEESGVLPVALGGSIQELWNCSPGVARIGLAGGFYHPTTGYSLPDAVRIAQLIARQPDLDGAALYRLLRTEARRLWRERRFYRLLNRMLLHAATPAERYRVLEHFYRLDDALIGRFYAARSKGSDKLHILSGRPPVPVGRALRALLS